MTFERKDEPEVALILVLDRSWSMAGPSMDLCKAAAQAAVDVMTDEQSLGVLTFNDQFDWDVPLRNVGQNRDEHPAEDRRRSSRGGHTLILPGGRTGVPRAASREGARQARRRCCRTAGRIRTTTRGSSRRWSDAHITVSSVAVGPVGRSRNCCATSRSGARDATIPSPNAKDLPQIFVKEAKNAATPAFDEKADHAGREGARVPGAASTSRTCRA